MTGRLRTLVLPLLAAVWVTACLAASTAAPAHAQEAPQYVNSQAAHRARIEGLIAERLSALVPSGRYVLNAQVLGQTVRVPRATAAGSQLDLPGFRATRGEFLAGEERFRVEQVVVRIVLNQTLPATEQQYLRTIVPILADFRAERGDRLDLQIITPEPPPGSEGAAAPFGEQPGALGDGVPFGLTWQEWLLIGVLALLLMLLLVLIWRMSAPRRAEPAPPPAPAAAPAPARESGEMEAERRRLEQEREIAEQRHGVVKRLFARPELARELLASAVSNPQRMKDLVHGLGPAVARKTLLPHMGRETYSEIEEQVLTEQAPDAARLAKALREANLFLMTQEIIHPEDRQPNPFTFLDALTWGQVAHLIKDEPVKVKALVLSRLNPDDTAHIIEPMSREEQLEIAVAIGNMADMPLDMAESVAIALAEKARFVPDARMVEVEGPAALVNVMGRASAGTSRYLLDAMKAKDTHLSAEVEKRFFLFDAIPLVPDDVMPQAVRTMPSDTVIAALQGAAPELQRKVIMAFPEQARPGLVTALRAARASPEQVEEARRAVVAQFQELGRTGRLNLKQISDAWQAQAQAS